MTVLSVNKSGWSRISVCLFCLLETTSVNKFMKSFPKSEYWHFKISWKHCQENFQFPWRDFFGLQDFDISMRSCLTSYSARFWPPRLWDLAKILLEILSRFSARFWDLVEILARISTRFWDLGENLGEFLAAEISPRTEILVKILQGMYQQIHKQRNY